MTVKSNHSILELNTLYGFDGNDIATKAYLFALERLPESSAFEFACRIQKLCTVMDITKRHGQKYYPKRYTAETHNDLTEYIMKRAWHMAKPN